MIETRRSPAPLFGLVHGMLDRPTVWDRIAPTLLRHGGVVAPEFSWGPASAPAAHRDDRGTLEFLGTVPPPVIIGHSRGAYEVVSEVVRTESAGAEILVLLGWSNQTPQRGYEVIPEGSAELREMCRDFISARSKVDGSPLSAARRDWLAEYAMRRLEAWDRNVFVAPSHLSTLDRPTLLISGENDHTLTVAEVEELQRLLPDAEVAIIADSGHWPMLEKPDAVTDAITDFLGRRAAFRPALTTSC